MSIERKLRGYILENFLFTNDDAALSSSDSFMAKGILDSTGIIEVILFMEEEFGVKVADEEMTPENLDSVTKLVAFIERKQAAA
jgi:acyl carrier protein